ncbi:hypothetical protein SKAU_G00384360 [Synaphobranchus kaupii]|uniref:Uncharacterized protein n=1 Tax=Synaphobranchus kaupii TaxID=118154 RepID=A0A9Q1IF32_SYNKA|nr:hypothetical protein SKAU_G00384360 [Synaphobranchus kaupii]
MSPDSWERRGDPTPWQGSQLQPDHQNGGVSRASSNPMNFIGVSPPPELSAAASIATITSGEARRKDGRFQRRAADRGNCA